MSAEPQSKAWTVMERGLLSTLPLAAEERVGQTRSVEMIEAVLADVGVAWTAEHLDGAAMMYAATAALTQAMGLHPIEAMGRVMIWLVENQDALRSAS